MKIKVVTISIGAVGSVQSKLEMIIRDIDIKIVGGGFWRFKETSCYLIGAINTRLSCEPVNT